VIEVRVEMLSLRDISAVRSLVVVTSLNVVDVINAAWTHADLGKISWPHSSVSIFCLILRKVRWVDVIRYNTISLIPLLIVVLLKVLVRWVDRKIFRYDRSQFELSVRFVK
jgi:ABC-type multidrug transport system fused ATPase/permease subunit